MDEMNKAETDRQKAADLAAKKDEEDYKNKAELLKKATENLKYYQDELAKNKGNIVNETIDKEYITQWQKEIDRLNALKSPTGVATNENNGLLKKANDLLTEYRKNREAAITESDIAKYNKLITLEEKEIQRLEKLGTFQSKAKSQYRIALEASLANYDQQLKMPKSGTVIAPFKQAEPVKPKIPEVGETSQKRIQSLQTEIKSFNFDIQSSAANLEKQLNDMQNFAAEWGVAVQTTLENVAVAFAESIGKMMVTGKGFDLSSILGAFADMCIELGKLAIAAGITGIALKNLIKNPFMAVVAGMALVALGSAVKAAATSITSGGGSIPMQASYGGGGNFDYNRDFGQVDTQPITVIVKGEIVGENIRLSNQRATLKHNLGY
jgi:hypothetical protein